MVQFNKEAVEKVIALAAEQWGLSPAEICGPRRTGRIAQARQASMAVSYWAGYGKSLDIAKAHSRDNHATVLHACNSVDSDTRMDPAYKAKVMAITSQI